METNKLAEMILTFYKDADPYDFMDSVEDEGMLIDNIKNDIISNKTDHIKECLNLHILEDGPEKDMAIIILEELKKRPVNGSFLN